MVVIYGSAILFKFLFEDPYVFLLKCTFGKSIKDKGNDSKEEKNNNFEGDLEKQGTEMDDSVKNNA